MSDEANRGGDQDERIGIDELAERGGVTRRTVRFYIQRGLLPAPEGLGRGRHYRREHLDRLLEVRRLQEQGVPLAAIIGRVGADTTATKPASGSGMAAAPELRAAARSLPVAADAGPLGSVWTRVVITPDVELHVRSGPLAQRALERLREAIIRVIEEETS